MANTTTSSSKPLGIVGRVLGYLSPTTTTELDTPIRTGRTIFRSPPVVAFQSSIISEEQANTESVETAAQVTNQTTPASNHGYNLRKGKRPVFSNFRNSFKYKLATTKPKKVKNVSGTESLEAGIRQPVVSSESVPSAPSFEPLSQDKQKHTQKAKGP